MGIFGRLVLTEDRPLDLDAYGFTGREPQRSENLYPKKKAGNAVRKFLGCQRKLGQTSRV